MNRRAVSWRLEEMGSNNSRAVENVYTITRARLRDLSRLPAIELAAAKLLAGYAPDSVLTETTSLEELLDAPRRVFDASGNPYGTSNGGDTHDFGRHLQTGLRNRWEWVG
jgi:hypothetical protein